MKEPIIDNTDTPQAPIIRSSAIIKLSNEIYFSKFLWLAFYNLFWTALFAYTTYFPGKNSVYSILYFAVQSALLLSFIDDDMQILKKLLRHPQKIISVLLCTIPIILLPLFLYGLIVAMPPLIVMIPALFFEFGQPFFRIIFLIIDRDIHLDSVWKVQYELLDYCRQERPGIFNIRLISKTSWFCGFIFTVATLLPFLGKLLTFPPYLKPFYVYSIYALLYCMVISYLLLIQITLYRVMSACYFNDMENPEEIEKWENNL